MKIPSIAEIDPSVPAFPGAMFSSPLTDWRTPMTKFCCVNCGARFTPAPQVPNQAYCSKPARKAAVDHDDIGVVLRKATAGRIDRRNVDSESMKFLIRLFLLVLPLAAAAQSKLPSCPASGYKHNCFGTITLANGSKYVGEYRDGKGNGQGTFTLANGSKYVGEFKDFMLNGRGTLTLANGSNYVGEFKDFRLDGLGIEYRSDGMISRSGQWVGGQLIQSFAIDGSRFPFVGSTQVAGSSVDSGGAERDRLAAEAEAARRRQQELEQKLAVERERERQTAEAEAARRKQQELEQRLATEAREREKQAAEVEAVRRRQQELEAQLAALQSQAASRPPNQAASSRSQRRVALVIGNAQYKVSPLDNPVNDATDIDRTLKQLGFQTTLLRNATLGQMREATRRFADQLQSADVALIYFAGHGVESNRKNYMIPVNADLKFEYELDDQAYNAGQWLDMLESIKSSNAERVNIVILDACRNNSLIGARSLGRGLGRMDAPTGTFLAYSTAPGKVAVDGTGNRNSPFTRHLLTVMQQPGLPIEEAFKQVRRNVSRETNGAQVPWESTSLTGFFTFRQTR
jgi:hypothetical protein